MRSVALATLVTGLLVVAGCSAWGGAGGGADRADPEAARALADQARSLFGSLPAEASSAQHAITEARVELGRMLYYDTRLSRSQQISCNSCHDLARYGVDGEPTSPGHAGQRGDRNSPTTYNAAFHVAQFWDGRAPDVEAQAMGPVANPVEMAMPSAPEVAALLRTIPGYVERFRAAFPEAAEPISLENAGRAIGAFERRLVTPGRFDRFLAGETGTLSAQEQRGLQTFIATGCTTCHSGATFGGTLFQKLGLVHPYETADLGRFKLSGSEADRHVFKVPSLRNVAETGPWFHDGSVKSLEEAVRLMAWHQLGRELASDQTQDLVAFLCALTGEIDRSYVARPTLPPNGPKTPGPS